MTTDEAKSLIVNLFREIESTGLQIDIESDYGADTRIDISNPTVTDGRAYWDGYRAVRFNDYHD